MMNTLWLRFLCRENAGKLSLLIMMLELKNSGVMEIFTIKMNLKIYFNNFQISRVV